MNKQRITILAQDPAVLANGTLLLAQVDVPHEILAPGPIGHRVKVVDFDATTDTLYEPHEYAYEDNGRLVDPYAPPDRPPVRTRRVELDQRLLGDPNFHAQHVYGVVMRTLARFEFALGRRVGWGFPGHQLHVAPHAFCEANAYYSKPDRALFFGYFTGRTGRTVFTCLSHDIVAHEATHALLDGLRDRYTDPSGPDQAAFHEGFSDVVALLSVFSLKQIVEVALTKSKSPIKTDSGIRLLAASHLTPKALAESILLGLGKEFGSQMEGARANALRRSVQLEPSRRFLSDPTFIESHDRGEVFAAALLRSFLEIWTSRIAQLGTFGRQRYNLDMVVEEGAKVADQLLTMVIRALDYCPSVDLEFGDYLAALLTVDRELVPDDSRFNYRGVVEKTFASYGILPPREATGSDGCWSAFTRHESVVYSKTNFEPMLRDREEVFRFIWENRFELGVDDRGYTEVMSVRPSTRQGPDGFVLKETVCEYVQILELFASELPAVMGFPRPEGMLPTQRVRTYGGGVLVFDQYGRIKYHIERRLGDVDRQEARVRYLWDTGALEEPVGARSNFAAAHRARATQG